MASIKFAAQIDYGRVTSSLKPHGLKDGNPSKGERTATLDARLRRSLQQAGEAVERKRTLDEKTKAIPRAEQRPKAMPQTKQRVFTVRVKDFDGGHDIRVFRAKSDNGEIPQIPREDLPACYEFDDLVLPMMHGSEVIAYARFSIDSNFAQRLKEVSVAAIEGAHLSGSEKQMVRQAFGVVKRSVAQVLKDEQSVPSMRCELVSEFGADDTVEHERMMGLFSYAAEQLSTERLVKASMVRYIERRKLAELLARPALRKIAISNLASISEPIKGSAFAHTSVKGIACDVDFVVSGG